MHHVEKNISWQAGVVQWVILDVVVKLWKQIRLGERLEVGQTHLKFKPLELEHFYDGYFSTSIGQLYILADIYSLARLNKTQ